MKTGKHLDFKRAGILTVILLAGGLVPYRLGEYIISLLSLYPDYPAFIVWAYGILSILALFAAIVILWLFTVPIWMAVRAYIYHNGGSDGNR